MRGPRPPAQKPALSHPCPPPWSPARVPTLGSDDTDDHQQQEAEAQGEQEEAGS